MKALWYEMAGRGIKIGQNVTVKKRRNEIYTY
jgi:hypothetical protein